jgi:hypothetical protein
MKEANPRTLSFLTLAAFERVAGEPLLADAGEAAVDGVLADGVAAAGVGFAGSGSCTRKGSTGLDL